MPGRDRFRRTGFSPGRCLVQASCDWTGPRHARFPSCKEHQLQMPDTHRRHQQGRQRTDSQTHQAQVRDSPGQLGHVLQARSPWFDPKCAHFFRIPVQLSLPPHWFQDRRTGAPPRPPAAPGALPAAGAARRPTCNGQTGRSPARKLPARPDGAGPGGRPVYGRDRSAGPGDGGVRPRSVMIGAAVGGPRL
jgi:hypothetical protein